MSYDPAFDTGLHIALDESGVWSMKVDLDVVEQTVKRLGNRKFATVAEGYIEAVCVKHGLEDDIELWTDTARVLADSYG